MRRVAVLLLFCCFLTSCVVQSDSLKKKSGEEIMESKISYEEGIYSNKNWDKIKTPIEMECIPDKETAIQIAKIYLQIESYCDKAENLSYNPTSVFYDTKEKIWIVSFSPFQNGMLIPDGGYKIALKKNNGEVLKMWTD